jgi:alpha,alpha-trehalose phosphorylase
VILQDAFTVQPWNLRETHLDLDLLAQTESVVALANGHVGWRANLDDGEPHGLPGSYSPRGLRVTAAALRGGSLRPPRDRQEVINLTNGKLPPVRRRRAVRRPVRRAALARAAA